MSIGKRITKTFVKALSGILALSFVMTSGMNEIYSFVNERADKSDSIGYGAVSGNDTGSGTWGMYTGSGIVSQGFPNSGFLVSLSREENLKFHTDGGSDPYTTLWNNASNGYVKGSETSEIYLLPSATKARMEGTPILTHTDGQSFVKKPSIGNTYWTSNSSSKPTSNGVHFTKILEYLNDTTGGKKKLIDEFDTWALSQNDLVKSVWNYIMTPISESGDYIEFNITGRVEEVYNHLGIDWGKYETLTGEDANKMFAECLDVLASLYALSSIAGSAKTEYKQAAIDYINGTDLKEKPITIKFAPAAMITDGRGNDYISSMLSTISLYAGITGSNKMDGAAFKSYVQSASPVIFSNDSSGPFKVQGDSYIMTLMAAQRSFDAGSRDASIYKKYDQTSLGNAMTAYFYGYNLIASKNVDPVGLNTGYGDSSSNAYGNGKIKFRAKLSNDSKANMNDTLVYHNRNIAAYRYLWRDVIWGEALLPLASPNVASINANFGKISALPDGQAIDGKTLGMPVTVNLFAGQDTQEKKDTWTTIINNAESNSATFKIEVEVERTNSPFGPATLPTFVLDGVTPEQMKNFINGTMLGTVIDDVSGYNKPGDSGEVDFEYKGTFKVTTSYGGNDYEFKGESEDPASFICLPERLGYTSTPEAYVELKNYGTSSNMNGKLSEDWEAMAGVPSTEQLYFAAGGSEFIVDITVEYVEDEVAKRSYDAFFTSTECEFLEGDNSTSTSANKDLLGTPIDTHTGGHYTATKRFDGKNTCTDVMGTCPCGKEFAVDHVLDTSPYAAKMAEAQAFAAQVNGTVKTHTDASHGTTRQFNGWNAQVYDTTDDDFHGSAGSAGTLGCNGHGCPGHGGGEDDPPWYHSYSNCDPGSKCDHSHPFEIWVEFDVPAHVLCGPCCEHIIPETHDTWATTWKYDSLKIVDVHVWQIDQAATQGLAEIIGPSVDIGGAQGTLDMGLVGADIRQGRPSIFYNIALKKDSKFTAEDGKGGATGSSAAGRVRYNLDGSWKDADQHDEVSWDLGSRKNTCDGLSTTHGTTVPEAISGKGHDEPKGKGFIYNNFKGSPSTKGASASGQKNFPVNTENFLEDNTDAVDKATPEYEKFLEKRKQSMTAWMITDFLILQTSNGNQSVIYYDAKSPSSVTAEQEIPELDVKVEAMWHNNQNSASGWAEDAINVGGYNGKYNKPTEKFKVKNNGKDPKTIFDGREGGGGKDPAKTISRPAKPTKNLMLYNGELNIILANTNKKYETGLSEVFWANTLHWTDVTSIRFSENPSPTVYSTTTKKGGATNFDFSRNCGVMNAGNNHAVPATDLKAPNFGPKAGYVMEAIYSPTHDKINDIIIHDPVSTEYVELVSLPKERDQRYGQVIGAEYAKNLINSAQVCPGEPGLCDFRTLNCSYASGQTVGNFDFDDIDENGNAINKITKNLLVLPSGFSYASAPSGMSGNAIYSNGGTRIQIPLSSELGIMYSPSVKLETSFDMRLTSLSSQQMIVSLQNYGLVVDSAGNIGFTTGSGDFRKATNIKIERDRTYSVSAVFSFKKIASCELTVDGVTAIFTASGVEPNDFESVDIGAALNIGSFGKTANYKMYGYIDNLVIERLPGSLEHTEDCYDTFMVHPNGINYHEHSASCINSGGWVRNYGPSTTPQEVELEPGTYTFEVWGASGGGNNRTLVDNREYEWMYSESGCSGYGQTTWSASRPNYNPVGHSCNPSNWVKTGNVRGTGSEVEWKYNQSGCSGYGTLVWSSVKPNYNPVGHSCDPTNWVQTGNTRTTYSGSNKGLGGYSKATYIVKNTTKIYLYIGTQGTLSSGYGYGGGSIGGGHGGANGYGGGGMSYISTNKNDKFDTGTRNENTSVTVGAGTFTGSSYFNDRDGSWVTVKNFTANANGYIDFYSTSYTSDPMGRILVNGSVVDQDDDGGSSLNFRTSASVRKGDTVSVQCIAYSSSGSCSWVCTHPGYIETTNAPVFKENVTFNHNDVIILAGGGGGADNASSEVELTNGDGSGGNGGGTSGGNAYYNGSARGGTGATQSSGYKRGIGQSASANSSGGAGAGWYGGSSVNIANGGGGGGSGYISNKCIDGVTTAGQNNGNGKIKITKISSVEAVATAIVNNTYTVKEMKDILGEEVYNKLVTSSMTGTEYEWVFTLSGCTSNGKTTWSATKPNYNPTPGHESCGTDHWSKTGNTRGMATVSSISQIIRDNWRKLPYWKADIEGDPNPVWECGYNPLNIHKCDLRCHEKTVLKCSEPHHNGLHYDGGNTVCWEACGNDENHKQFKSQIEIGDKTFEPGNFINLDWGFDVYFPNVGDFEQGQPYGLGQLTATRGKGFKNRLDTTKWTRVKKIKFSVNVIRNGQLYLAGEWITLADRGEYTGADGSKYNEANWTNYGQEICDAISGDLIDGARECIYRFYCVEANEEMRSSRAEVQVEAVNCPGENDNLTSPTNKKRSVSFKSLHGGYNDFYFDVVGRIGNLVLEDTGDYRFSNLFKQTIENEAVREDPTVYREADGGLNTINGATAIDGIIQANTTNSGAHLSGLSMIPGQYKLIIKGEKLNNGALKIETQSGWVVAGDYDINNGMTFTDDSDGTLEGDTNSTKIVVGPNMHLEPGKYEIDIYGQGFLSEDWKLVSYDAVNDVYNDITSMCEHTGGDNENHSMIFTVTTPMNNIGVYCQSVGNLGFIFDRIILKKLDSDTIKNIATTDAVSKITVSTMIMSYYINIPEQTPADIYYTATNAGGMEIEYMSIQRLGDFDDSWIVEGIVKKVDESQQNEYFSWGINDIRGVKVSADTQWLNTYSTQNWMNKAPLRLPLSPDKNNISILRDEPMLVGYDQYIDISTIGNYFKNDYSFLQVIPSYYVVDLNKPNVEPIPVDAYLKYSNGYYPINIFGLMTGENQSVTNAYEGYNDLTINDVYNFVLNLDWESENARRNYKNLEKFLTESLAPMYPDISPAGIARNMYTPAGHTYNIGNPQFIQVDGKARTFIGGETTYGELMNLGGANQILEDEYGRKYNPEGRIQDDNWWVKAQRWHFTLGLPSSTIFVRQGSEPDAVTINEFKAANYVILCAVDIRAIGTVWQLRYSHGDLGSYGFTNGEKVPGDNGIIQVTSRDGTVLTYPIPPELPPVLAVYSSVKSSEFDIDIVGIH